MATTNRAITTAEINSLQPSVTINAALEILDAAVYGRTAIEFATDANRTLTAVECDCALMEFTDSPSTLTTGRDVVFPARFPNIVAVNSTAQTLALKKSGQTGITLAAGATAFISAGNTDVVEVSTGGGGGTIADDSVTNAKLANVATQTFKGRATASTGDPEDLTAAQAAAIVQGDGLTVDLCGFRGIPQNSKSAAYTLVAADAGKHIYHPSTDANARTFTIPANSSVAFPIGTSVTFINETSQVVSIAITTDTLVLAGTGTTGTRSLAQYGVATAIKVTSTRWVISGTGLT